jgi:hypothetical protein
MITAFPLPMRSFTLLLCLSFLHVLIGACLNAAVSLPALFSDGMVIQRDQPVPVWGKAAPGEKVAVMFRKDAAKTEADASGHWRVVLPAQAAGTEDGELVVSGPNTVTIRNVAVGEVWICSGQSNMAFTVAKAARAKEEIAAATIDIGDPDNVHPANKQEAGRRLALIALNRLHGRRVVCTGPVPVGTTVAEEGLRVRFDQPLVLNGDGAGSFEIAGADGHFVPAAAKAAGDSLLLSNTEVAGPVAARYAWSNNPAAILFNKEKLPAAPFLVVAENK